MRVSKLNVAARSCSLSRTLMQTDTDTSAAATQWERRRRKMLSVLRSPFYAHFKIFAVYFVSFFYLIWLLVFFASFLCTVSLFFCVFVFNQNALLLLLLLPAAAGLANTFLVSVSLRLWWEDIDSTHTHSRNSRRRQGGRGSSSSSSSKCRQSWLCLFSSDTKTTTNVGATTSVKHPPK